MTEHEIAALAADMVSQRIAHAMVLGSLILGAVAIAAMIPAWLQLRRIEREMRPGHIKRGWFGRVYVSRDRSGDEPPPSRAAWKDRS